jgi:hypothetical protein
VLCTNVVVEGRAVGSGGIGEVKGPPPRKELMMLSWLASKGSGVERVRVSNVENATSAELVKEKVPDELVPRQEEPEHGLSSKPREAPASTSGGGLVEEAWHLGPGHKSSGKPRDRLMSISGGTLLS